MTGVGSGSIGSGLGDGAIGFFSALCERIKNVANCPRVVPSVGWNNVSVVMPFSDNTSIYYRNSSRAR